MPLDEKSLTIEQAMYRYIDSVGLARSQNTARSYQNAINAFKILLVGRNLPADKTPLKELTEDGISWFAQALKDHSPATEQLYLTALAGFYDYLVAERLSDLNLPRVRLLIRQRSRKPGPRLPQFPQADIEKTIQYAINIASYSYESINGHLILLRDRAFILTLADTGLRVHEACSLRRGDLDWNEQKAIVIGKGNREAVVRFSIRSLHAIKNYIHVRSEFDGASGRPLPSLPLFARHDRGAGKKIKPITTATGRNIIHQRVTEAIGSAAADAITPHSFRHYFVTTVLRGSGGNLKMAQELARHRNIAVTQRYAHLSDDELDKTYEKIFDNTEPKNEQPD